MLKTLKTAYSDTRASDLAWALGREPLPALAVLDLQLGEYGVQLRLLGASHQVIVGGERGDCSETVACMPGSSTPLPVGLVKRVGNWEYEFAARVETLSRGSFEGRAQELLELVSDHPHGLAGTFPGSPHAFTAMLAQRHEERLRWRTWHAYPQEGRLVATRTQVAAHRPTGRGTGDDVDVDVDAEVETGSGSGSGAGSGRGSVNGGGTRAGDGSGVGGDGAKPRLARA